MEKLFDALKAAIPKLLLKGSAEILRKNFGKQKKNFEFFQAFLFLSFFDKETLTRYA